MQLTIRLIITGLTSSDKILKKRVCSKLLRGGFSFEGRWNHAVDRKGSKERLNQSNNHSCQPQLDCPALPVPAELAFNGDSLERETNQLALPCPNHAEFNHHLSERMLDRPALSWSSIITDLNKRPTDWPCLPQSRMHSIITYLSWSLTLGGAASSIWADS